MSSADGSQERPRLFVYGSLRAGAAHPMHRVVAEGGAHLGVGSICAELYRVSWYPGAVPASHPRARVLGDVWELADAACLARLDAYEGCGPSDPPPHEYERREVEVTLERGSTLTTWTYLYAWPTEELDRIHSGDWLLHVQRS